MNKIALNKLVAVLIYPWASILTLRVLTLKPQTLDIRSINRETWIDTRRAR